jgi:hypothetical protein
MEVRESYFNIKESEERRRKRTMIRRTRVVRRNTGEKRKIIMLLSNLTDNISNYYEQNTLVSEIVLQIFLHEKPILCMCPLSFF